MRRFIALPLLLCAAQAAVLDRVAVTVGKDVITQSEVLQELRLTDFLNQAPLDLGPAARREAAERMVDQDLVRTEMTLENFVTAPPANIDQTLREFKQAHFRTHAQYLASLQKYGVTEDELKRYLLWQVTALRFTDQRFRAGAPPPVAGGKAPNQADRQAQPEKTSDASVDEQLDTWLKQTRAQTKIQFHKEALE